MGPVNRQHWSCFSDMGTPIPIRVGDILGMVLSIVSRGAAVRIPS